MFSTLLESRAQRQRNPEGQALSLALHAVAIAVAVIATRGVVTANPAPDERVFRMAAPVPPPPPEVQQAPPPDAVVAPPIAKGHQVLIAPIVIPDVLPAIDLTRPITDAADYTGTGVRRGRDDGVVGATATTTADIAYFLAQVDKPAALAPGAAAPEYPSVLQDAGIAGDVRVTFTVDTAGRADMSSLKVTSSTHQQFTDAVTKALARMRFLPAMIGDRKVRQLVEMPFRFTPR